jgi:hypothetical protein
MKWMIAVELKNMFESEKRTNLYMPLTLYERHGGQLNGFLDQSGPQAAGTDFNALRGTLHECTNCAKVRPEDPFGPVIGVTDIVSH